MVPADSRRIPRVPRYSGYHYASSCFEYRTVTVSGQSFQTVLLTRVLATPWSYNPIHAVTWMVWALPFSLAATHRITCCFLFLRLLRCFSSPGSPPYVMDWRMDTWGVLMWVSPFRDLRVNGYLLLTAAYRSLSRLSSALSAKASTLRSSSLDRVVIRSTLFGSCEQ